MYSSLVTHQVTPYTLHLSRMGPVICIFIAMLCMDSSLFNFGGGMMMYLSVTGA